MSSVAGQAKRYLHLLEKQVPEGVIVTSSWLRRHGYSRQLLSHYVRTGWLRQPNARRLSAAPRLLKLAADRDLASDDSERTSGGWRTYCARNTRVGALPAANDERGLPLRTGTPPNWLSKLPGEGPFHLSQQAQTLHGRSGSKVVHELDHGRQGATEPGGGRRLSRPALGGGGNGASFYRHPSGRSLKRSMSCRGERVLNKRTN